LYIIRESSNGNADALSRLPAYGEAKEKEGSSQGPAISVCADKEAPQVVQKKTNVGVGDNLAQAQ